MFVFPLLGQNFTLERGHAYSWRWGRKGKEKRWQAQVSPLLPGHLPEKFGFTFFFIFFFFHFGLPWKMSLNEVLHGLLKTSCDVTMASLGVKRTGTLLEEPFKSLHMKPSYCACWYLKLTLKLQFILQHTGMYTLHTLPLYTEHVKWSETVLAWGSGANGMLSVSTHRPAQDMQGPLNYCKLLCDIAWLG